MSRCRFIQRRCGGWWRGRVREGVLGGSGPLPNNESQGERAEGGRGQGSQDEGIAPLLLGAPKSHVETHAHDDDDCRKDHPRHTGEQTEPVGPVLILLCEPVGLVPELPLIGGVSHADRLPEDIELAVLVLDALPLNLDEILKDHILPVRLRGDGGVFAAGRNGALGLGFVTHQPTGLALETSLRAWSPNTSMANSMEMVNTRNPP